MIVRARMSTVLIALAATALVVTGCSATPSANTPDAKPDTTEQAAPAGQQTTEEACGIVKDVMLEMVGSLRNESPDGATVDAAERQRLAQLAADAMAAGSTKITNLEVSKLFSAIVDDYEAMSVSDAEQSQAQAENGVVPDELKEQLNRFNEDMSALGEMCP